MKKKKRKPEKVSRIKKRAHTQILNYRRLKKKNPTSSRLKSIDDFSSRNNESVSIFLFRYFFAVVETIFVADPM